MSAYSEASRAVFAVFEDTTPLVEGLSIDEAFLDVRGMERIAGHPEEIAVRLRRRVLEEVGLPITVGVARTKFLAKVASSPRIKRCANACQGPKRRDPRAPTNSARMARRQELLRREMRRRAHYSALGPR
jgi:nucleotidyltransferase/DNA polymerase involved in DNA repair